MHELGTTIVAVATAPGRGGVGCVRLSGPAAAEIAARLFRPAGAERPLATGDAPRFGRFVGRENRGLDHGFVVAFPAGASYTGELTVELWAHGSPAVLDELVAAAMGAGAVPAGPGEFTYRAVASGRLDLTRAEAVRDLVEARTLYQARVAFAQAEGALSESLRPLRETLEEWIARGEAAIEFVEESETHLPPGALARAIGDAVATCGCLLEGFRTGRVVRDGATLAMIGLPNVGKSLLFNRLLARDRAIVTSRAGTTRDTLEEDLSLDGIPVRLIDTAGLREVTDEIESEGVRRAHRAREEADLVLLVLDGSREVEPLEVEALERSRGDLEKQRTVVAVNKCDLPGARDRAVPHPAPQRVSALTGEDIDGLRAELRRRLLGAGPVEDPIVTNHRHAAALEQTRSALERAARAAGEGLSEELLLEDLRQAMRHLGEITGEFGTEALYDRIFSTFCIGK
jgi:tRNA modification GTPase